MMIHFLYETFLILRRTEHDIIKKMYDGLRVKCRILLLGCNEKLDFLDRSPELFTSIKFHENPSGTSRVVADGGTIIT